MALSRLLKYGRSLFKKKPLPVESPVESNPETQSDDECEEGYVSTDSEDYVNTYSQFITRKNMDSPPPRRRRNGNGNLTRPKSAYPVYIATDSSVNDSQPFNKDGLTFDQVMDRYGGSNNRYLGEGSSSRAGFYKVLDADETEGPIDPPYRRLPKKDSHCVKRTQTFPSYDGGSPRQPYMKFQSAGDRRLAAKRAARATNTIRRLNLEQRESFTQSFKSFFSFRLAKLKSNTKDINPKSLIGRLSPKKHLKKLNICSRERLNTFWERLKTLNITLPAVTEPVVKPRREIFGPTLEWLSSPSVLKHEFIPRQSYAFTPGGIKIAIRCADVGLVQHAVEWRPGNA